MITRIITAIVFFSCFAVSGQMQNKKWHQFPATGGFGANVLDRTSSIDILENGNIYFTYYDQNTSLLTINRFDVLNNQWIQIESISLTGTNVNFVSAYAAGNNLYVGWVESISGSFVSLARLDQNEQLQFIINNAGTSLDAFQNSSIEFTVDELSNLVYTVVKGSNSDVYVDKYNLVSGTYEGGTYVGYLSANQPKIALDYTASLIYVVGNDFSQKLLVHSSPFGATLNFAPLGGTGFVYSSYYPAEAVASNFDIIEKTNNSPELIFLHVESSLETEYNIRIGLGGNNNTDIGIMQPNVLFGSSGPSKGTSSFILGSDLITSEMFVEELFPDGTHAKVALNNNPLLSSIEGVAYKLSHNKMNNRLAIFYHSPGGDGSDAGIVGLTNTPPQLISNIIQSGCVGGFSIFLKDILFSDSEGDNVSILNTFQSTNLAVIDPNTLFAYEAANGGWVIDGSGGVEGVTDLTFSYTDGLDTITETVTIEVVAPSTPNFLESPISFCVNEGIIDLNDYVDLAGGEFMFDESNSIEEGILDLSVYNDPALLPFNSFVDYSYFDENGCSSYISSNVIILPTPSATLAITNGACGAASGSIQATVDSPNGTFFSYWNTGNQDQLNIGGLTPGAYYLNVFDEAGCMIVAQGTVEASDITASAQIIPVSCHDGNDGSIDLTVGGPGAPYSVFWSTGASIPTISNLTPGIYDAVITDVNGCQVTYSYALMNPAQLELDLLSTLPSFCGANDGALESIVTNGVGNISYQWSTGASSIDLFGLSGGMFSLTITDENGCTASKSKNVIPSTGIFASGNVLRANCDTNDGAIEVDLFPAFGESVASIEWSNGATTQNIYNLSPGYYECIATQSNGCESVFGWTVNSFKPQKPSICIVTVDSITTSNLIVWEKELTNNIDHYRIYRESNVAGQFQLIDTVHYSNISVFNDVVASPKTKSWRYKISAVNACGDESPLSSTHKTIHLTTQDIGSGEFKVTWDNYEGFSFSEYDVYRYTNQTGWELILDNVPFLALPYTFDTPPSVDGLDYMIEIDPGFQCTATFGKAQDYNSSRSNKASGQFNPGIGTGDPNNSIVEFESESMSVSIFPNPSDGAFNVDLKFIESSKDAELFVTDISGKIILHQKVSNGMNLLNLKESKAGMYLVTIRDTESSIVVRIVKN